MSLLEKIKQLFAVSRDVKEVERWMFSLTPLAVAFAFFVVFLSSIEIANKDVIYTIGITAGFTGLQAYWVIRGWRRNEGVTVILGLIGIAIAVGLAWTYLHFFRT